MDKFTFVEIVKYDLIRAALTLRFILSVILSIIIQCLSCWTCRWISLLVCPVLNKIYNTLCITRRPTETHSFRSYMSQSTITSHSTMYLNNQKINQNSKIDVDHVGLEYTQGTSLWNYPSWIWIKISIIFGFLFIIFSTGFSNLIQRDRWKTFSFNSFLKKWLRLNCALPDKIFFCRFIQINFSNWVIPTTVWQIYSAKYPYLSYYL